MRKLLIVATFLATAFLAGRFWQEGLNADAQVGGGGTVSPCDADPTQYSLDTNDDGGIDLSDFVFGLSWFFSGSEAPRVCLGEPVGDPGCPGVETRTPLEAVTAYHVHLALEDWEAVACDYAPTAFVINDQGTCLGRQDIIAAHQANADFFGHQRPAVSQLDAHLNIVRMLYTFDNGTIIIADGTDTFVVENGQIQGQTTHSKVEFAGGGGGR